MQNIAIILALLLLPYWGLSYAHVPEPLRARVGVALVFAFAGNGPFHQDLGHDSNAAGMGAAARPTYLHHRCLRGACCYRGSHPTTIPTCWPGAMRLLDSNFSFQRLCCFSAGRFWRSRNGTRLPASPSPPLVASYWMGLLVCSQINIIDIMTRTDLLKVSFFACVGSSHLVKRERGVKTQSNRGKLSVLVTLVALATVWALPSPAWHRSR